jgi:VRR-NUC domain
MTFLAAVPRISERRFAQQIVEHAELMGWRVYHTHRSEHSPAGFPRSLVLCRVRHARPRIVWLEVKAERGRLTDAQRAWVNDLADCGQEVHVVRPSQWEEVEAWLR